MALGSAVALVVTPLFAAVIDRGFITMEERSLEEEFGDAYRAYYRRYVGGSGQSPWGRHRSLAPSCSASPGMSAWQARPAAAT